jgi:hypothetical protein
MLPSDASNIQSENSDPHSIISTSHPTCEYCDFPSVQGTPISSRDVDTCTSCPHRHSQSFDQQHSHCTHVSLSAPRSPSPSLQFHHVPSFRPLPSSLFQCSHEFTSTGSSSRGSTSPALVVSMPDATALCPMDSPPPQQMTSTIHTKQHHHACVVPSNSLHPVLE